MQEMRKQNLPIRFLQLRKQVIQHALVHGVQILDVERRVGVTALEVTRVERLPGIVAHENKAPLRLPELEQNVVLFDRRTCDIVFEVKECRQAPSGDAL